MAQTTTKETTRSKIAQRVIADGQQCDIETVQRLFDSLDDDGQKWLVSASESEIITWAFDTLRNTQPPA